MPDDNITADPGQTWEAGYAACASDIRKFLVRFLPVSQKNKDLLEHLEVITLGGVHSSPYDRKSA